MEELLKVKDTELAQLRKVKDALKDQLQTLKEKIKEPKAPAYPDLSPQLETSRNQLEEAEQKLRKMTVENEQLQSQITVLNKEPLTPEKLMEQLKNGMFKLGQQNFSIEEKLDKLLQKIETGDLGETKTASPSSYRLPGLAQSQTTPVSHRKKVSVRKPSDVLHKREDQAPKKTLKPLQKSASAPGAGGKQLITLPYVEAGQSIICPHCGEQDFGEQPDQSRIIAYAPVKKYAKKTIAKAVEKNGVTNKIGLSEGVRKIANYRWTSYYY